jgi:hypothetical protein
MRNKPIPLSYSVWMEPEKAKEFAANLRKRGHRCYIVRRKVSKP